MGQDISNTTGICGLYCGTCPNYLASRKNDSEQLKKISQKTGIPIEEVRCDGCLSDNVFAPCVDCKHGFRRCAEEKEVTWCFQCHDLPCRRLKDFKDVHIVNGISHHAHVIEDLKYVREHGIEKWLVVQEKAGQCPRCGTMLYWHVRECPDCHG